MWLMVHKDLQTIMYECMFGPEEAKEKAKEKFPGAVAAILKDVEKLLPVTGFIQGGDAPTLADLAIFDPCTSVFPGLKKLNVDLTGHPKLNALVAKVGEFEPVKKYCAERGF